MPRPYWRHTCDRGMSNFGPARCPDGEVATASNRLGQQSEPAADLGRHDVGHAEGHAAQQLTPPEQRGRGVSTLRWMRQNREIDMFNSSRAGRNRDDRCPANHRYGKKTMIILSGLAGRGGVAGLSSAAAEDSARKFSFCEYICKTLPPCLHEEFTAEPGGAGH